mmetsp:Transcript_13187/g.22360  ORF Transcript_13187/g.22360 Transcript_13187/m.22360 type:complete len:171 (+) Transcript_13187:135-647(+)
MLPQANQSMQGQVDPAQQQQMEEQQRIQQQQEQFRQNIQNFIGGLNCSVGLVYGVTQIGYLGSQGAKYFWMAVKFVLGKVFDRRNLTVPLGFLSKIILGTNVLKTSSQSSDLRRINHEIMRATWTQIKAASSSEERRSIFQKLASLALKFARTFALMIFGMAGALVMMLF